MNPNATVTEGINPRILELLGLEGTFDLDADTYIQSIKERLLRVTAFGEKLPQEDFDLLRQELKRVQKSKDKEFKNKKISSNKLLGYKKKSTKPNISSKKLLLPGTTASTLVKTREIEKKSKIVSKLKTEQGNHSSTSLGIQDKDEETRKQPTKKLPRTNNIFKRI